MVLLKKTILTYLAIKETNFNYSTYPKMFSWLHINKTAGMDQILVNFLKAAASYVGLSTVWNYTFIGEIIRISRGM